MRNFVLLLLAVLSTSAAAQWGKWTIVDQSESFVVYVDTATIRRSDNIAHMWDLSDAVSGKGFGRMRQSRSFTIEREYDCARQQLRVLYVAWYAQPMGEGKIVGSQSHPGIWQPAMLGTIGEELWRIACAAGYRRRF